MPSLASQEETGWGRSPCLCSLLASLAAQSCLVSQRDRASCSVIDTRWMLTKGQARKRGAWAAVRGKRVGWLVSQTGCPYLGRVTARGGVFANPLGQTRGGAAMDMVLRTEGMCGTRLHSFRAP